MKSLFYTSLSQLFLLVKVLSQYLFILDTMSLFTSVFFFLATLRHFSQNSSLALIPLTFVFTALLNFHFLSIFALDFSR
jgi:hypothetical protein